MEFSKKKRSNVFSFYLYKLFSTQISHPQMKNCDQQLENRKMPIKSVKLEFSRKKCFFFHFPRIMDHSNQKILFVALKNRDQQRQFSDWLGQCFSWVCDLTRYYTAFSKVINPSASTTSETTLREYRNNRQQNKQSSYQKHRKHITVSTPFLPI